MGPVGWNVIGTASAVLATAAAHRGLSAVWRLATGDDPPTIPEDPDTNWPEAIAWAVLSGAVVGLARLVATRQAAHYYARSTGELPRPLQRTT